MKLRTLHVQNFRSIVDTKEFTLQDMFALIGENNCGKSNILRSIECLTSAAAGGVRKDDFNDLEKPIIIKGIFDKLNATEKKRWGSYIIGEQLILEKHVELIADAKKGSEKAEGKFHGYKAEPKDWFLSFPKIKEKHGDRPKWADIVSSTKLPEYFIVNGKCTKQEYEKGVERYLAENDVEYDEPDKSQTQALGLSSNVVATLPQVYLLEAITDYSSEIDKRTSSTTFRRLMGDLSERILTNDPKYKDVIDALSKIKQLLNPSKQGTDIRLESIGRIEGKITEMLKRLMPSVQNVSMGIEVEDIKEIFSAGVSLSVDDGVETDVLAKGHGLQRCIVFTLLQSLIMNQRNQLLGEDPPARDDFQSIILCIEEPELYIHPQLCKLFYDVMEQFSKTDQVIYTTHSPLFIDAYEYDSIGIVKKETMARGTVLTNCNSTAFDGMTEKKVFQGLTRLNPAINEMFFARNVLIVEGPEDLIAVTAVLLKNKKIKTRVEELDYTITVAGGKPGIPFLLRVLNAFGINYRVLHDLDIILGMANDAKETEEQRNQLIKDLSTTAPINFPIKLENTLGLAKGHLSDQYDAHKFFSEETNIHADLEAIILPIFS